MSRNRVRALAVIVILAAIGLLVAPTAVLHRLTLLDRRGRSRHKRIRPVRDCNPRCPALNLLKRSVSETISHPLFGVGPGQFPVRSWKRRKRKTTWFQWLGTHNSYTQVSSECGIPAFICYLAV